MTDMAPCPRCGGTSGGIGKSGLCPACLLGLAIGADDESGREELAETEGPVYRVLTILATEPGRTTYLAEQDVTRRLVTLDVVRVASAPAAAGPGGGEERVRALRRWAHPGVPRVVEGRRTAAGEICVVSHYVAASPLDRCCEAGRIDGASRARLFARVCEIVSDGHRHGVCHGRLRPDLVVGCGTGGRLTPSVLGYSVCAGPTPTVADDVAGLERVARAMGWRGPAGQAWRSVEELLAATTEGWTARPAGTPREETSG